MSKHIALYPRVSSGKQDEASQLPDLERWAANQDAPVKWYRDKFTGKTMDRPGWNKLEEAIRSGKVSTIVIWRIDRLGRTSAGLTALFDELRARKINLISLREGFDLSTPAGHCFAVMLAGMAEYETEVRMERVRAGLEVARENGVVLGRPKGRKTDPDKRKVTPDQERIVREMNDRGEPKAAIARATGLSRPTVYAILAESTEAAASAAV